jgi:ABC-type glycerol-3-phosphate transport system substrate-binding protein
VKEYLSYGDVSGINGFNARTLELKQQNKTSLDLFIKGEVYMVVGYPSFVNRIKEAGGFSKSFLQVAPFPHNFSGGGETLANYNYFVINKNTLSMEFAQDFLAYLSSDT